MKEDTGTGTYRANHYKDVLARPVLQIQNRDPVLF
jgi:hypothetical protein